MSHRSKREVAPSTPQAPAAAGVPWWGAAAKPHVSTPVPSESMAPPPGWWPGALPQHNSFVSQYGPWMGVVPTPNGHINLDASTDSLEFMPGGFQSLLRNGLPSYPATHSDPINQHVASGSKRNTVINIDDGEEIRKEKRLSWEPDEDVRLMSAWLFHSNDPINGNGKKMIIIGEMCMQTITALQLLIGKGK